MKLLVGTVGSPAMLAGDLARRCDLVTRAVEVGLDHLFLADHVSFHSGRGMDGLLNAATLASTHPRITICVGVYLLALRHPVPVARQLSSLSHSAPGRIVLGVGVGGEDRHEIEVCGVDPRTRGRRTDESLEALQGLLSGRPTSHHGEFFDFEEALIVPPPEPRIPILIGGRSQAAVRRTARFGDGWLGAWCSPQRMTAVAQELSGEPRSTPWLHGLQVWVGLDADRSKARKRLAQEMEDFYQVPFESFERYCPYGTPEEVAALLAEYVPAGCRLFNVKPVASTEEAGIDAVGEVARILRQSIPPGTPDSAGAPGDERS